MVLFFFLQAVNTHTIGSSFVGVADITQGNAFHLNPATINLEQKALNLGISYTSLIENKFLYISDTNPRIFKSGLGLSLDDKNSWEATLLMGVSLKVIDFGLLTIFSKDRIELWRLGGFLSFSDITFGISADFSSKFLLQSFQAGAGVIIKSLFLEADLKATDSIIERMGMKGMVVFKENIKITVSGYKNIPDKFYVGSLGLSYSLQNFVFSGAYSRNITLKTNMFSMGFGISL